MVWGAGFCRERRPAFCFAEQRIGSARGAENVLGLILGTGVGSGIVINGKIYSGSSGFAGEIGHSFFSLDDSPRIEEWLSGTALKKILASHGKSPHLFENIHGCSNQDEIVDAMYHQWAEHLSRFVINLVLAYDPKVIVFGGGVGIHILPHFLPFVRERVNTFFEQKNYPFSFDLRISTQKNAGALGAALYAKENS
jgi:glucokinase